jgi:murein DD-endopeptidase MepM/ murein hydrolase activator NlpD
MNLIGLRIAIEQRPELARAMGGVITQEQQKEIEDIYRQKLGALNDQLEGITIELAEIRRQKDKFAQLATPRALINSQKSLESSMGGPYKPVSTNKDKDIFKALDHSISDSAEFKKFLSNARKEWVKEYELLNALPSSIPMASSYKITSSFGVRPDPYLGRPSQHEGLDFSAPIGTVILASGNGIVHKAGFDKEYGNFIEIKHLHGYITKYAHASELLVQENQRVSRGDPIAKVGNSGRSTGPHLHYEVIRDGGLFKSDRKLNPSEMLIGINN